jgi:hypothetical protein
MTDGSSAVAFSLTRGSASAIAARGECAAPPAMWALGRGLYGACGYICGPGLIMGWAGTGRANRSKNRIDYRGLPKHVRTSWRRQAILI